MLKQQPPDAISQFCGLPGAQLAGSCTVFGGFSSTCNQMGLDPQCYCVWPLSPCGISCSGSSLHGLPPYPGLFTWPALGLQVEEWKWSDLLRARLAGLRMLLPPHSSGQSSHRPGPGSRGGARVPSLKGKAQMFGVILHVLSPQLQGSSPAASW